MEQGVCVPQQVATPFTNSEQREVVHRIPRLIEVLRDATLDIKRSLQNPNIKKINLGIFAKEAERLRRITANDPKHSEAGKLVLVKNGEVIIEPVVKLGNSSRVTSSVWIRPNNDFEQIPNLPKVLRQDVFISTLLHSHPIWVPPTIKDVIPIFFDENERRDARTCVFVANPEHNDLIFRSSKTPTLKQSEIPAFEQAWVRKLEASASRLTKDMVWETVTSLFGRKAKSSQEWLKLHAISDQKILDGIMEDFGLIAFRGHRDSGIVERVTA